MRVLIADRDPNDLEATRLALQSPDIELVTASDGPDVVRKCVEYSPDVIVMSASLGSMGAFGVSRELTELEGTGDVIAPAIIVILERDADRWQAANAGIRTVLRRPVDPAELEDLVRSASERASA